MANTNILQLPVAVSVSSDWYIPLQADGLTTQRATIATISGAITGFVPDTATIRGGFGISITNGGLLVDSPQINFDPAAMAPVGAMDVADSFVICQTSSTGEAHIATFPSAMEALTGLPELNMPDLANDYLIINHAADGTTYKVSPSGLSLASGNMPAGGLAGQILTKASDANYDTTWTSGGFIDQNANTVFAGPTSGAAAQPQFRALVGADLPNPGASSKGGVQSKAAASNQFLTQIGTDGTVSAAQPAFTDISGVATAAQGGTGQSSYTIGDLLYASGTTALSKLADVATGNALISGGVGVAPSWGKIGLTTHITGTLAVGNGGTGQTTLAAHGVLVGNDASGISVTGAGTLGQVLTSNGASADPTFQDATTALGQALTKTDDTNVTLTLGGAPTTALLSATSLTLGWTGTLSGARGGTGVANTGKTITLGGNLTTSGAFNATFTLTNTTAVTFPTSGTLATTAGASLPSIAQGDLLYGSASQTLSTLTKNTSATRYLSNAGPSNNPAWSQIDLTSGVTGALPVANGGTGLTSGTSGGILGFTASGTLASSVELTSHALVIGGGAGATPTPLASLGTTTTVLHGNASGDPTWGAVSLTADISGTLGVGNGGTGGTNWNINGVLYGNTTSALQVTAAGSTGDVLAGTTSAAPSFQNLSTVLDSFGNTWGSLLFRGTSGWTVLAPGTGGTVLSTNGSGADPSWISVGGTGTVTSVDVSGGTTGLTTSGGPIVGAGTITLAGTLGTANGGTNFTSYTQGDLLYASSSSVLSKLPKDTNATRYLANTGSSNNPSWSQINLANGVTGTLPLANGGLGLTSGTSGGILGFTASGTLASSVALTANALVRGGGAGATPVPAQIQEDGAGNLTGAVSLNAGPFGGLRNYVINPLGYFTQAGLAPTSDGAYTGFDQWYALMQTAAVGAITPSQLTAVETGMPYAMRFTQSNASSQRYGICQPIESANTAFLAGQTVTLSARVRMSASTTLCYAIVEWTGTNNAITRDIVNDWTSTNYTTGNFFISTNTTVTANGSTALTANTWANISLSGTISSSAANLILFIWTSSSQAQNVTLDVSKVQLEVGSTATAFEFQPVTVDLVACERFYATTYNFGVAPGTAGGAGGIFHVVEATCNYPNLSTWSLPVQMVKTPNATVYSTTTGASGKIRNVNAGTDVNGNIGVSSQMTISAYVNNVSVSANQTIQAHLTADARL